MGRYFDVRVVKAKFGGNPIRPIRPIAMVFTERNRVNRMNRAPTNIEKNNNQSVVKTFDFSAAQGRLSGQTCRSVVVY